MLFSSITACLLTTLTLMPLASVAAPRPGDIPILEDTVITVANDDTEIVHDNSTISTAEELTNLGPQRLSKRETASKEPVWTPPSIVSRTCTLSGGPCNNIFLDWTNGWPAYTKPLMQASVEAIPSQCSGTCPSITAAVQSGSGSPPLLDTGASLILIGANQIGGIDNAVLLDPSTTGGYQYYPHWFSGSPRNLSGMLKLGKWVKLSVKLTGANGNSVWASPKVLVVYWQGYCPGFNPATHFTPGMAGCPSSLWVGTGSDATAPVSSGNVGASSTYTPSFGIGWGQFGDTPPNTQYVRELTHFQRGTTGTKSVLSLANGWAKGYIIGKAGIQFGLTTVTGMKWQALAHATGSTSWDDWARPAGCITLVNEAGTESSTCHRGTIIPDSGWGYGNMQFELPSSVDYSAYKVSSTDKRFKAHHGIKMYFGFKSSGAFSSQVIAGSTNSNKATYAPGADFAPGDSATDVVELNPKIVTNTAAEISAGLTGFMINSGTAHFDHLDMGFAPGTYTTQQDWSGGYAGFRERVDAPWPIA